MTNRKGTHRVVRCCLAIRAIAQRIGTGTKVSDLISAEMKYCFEDEDLDHVCSHLGSQKIRRIPVLGRDKQIVGIPSLSDVAVETGGDGAGEALAALSRLPRRAQPARDAAALR